MEARWIKFWLAEKYDWYVQRGKHPEEYIIYSSEHPVVVVKVVSLTCSPDKRRILLWQRAAENHTVSNGSAPSSCIKSSVEVEQCGQANFHMSTKSKWLVVTGSLQLASLSKSTYESLVALVHANSMTSPQYSSTTSQPHHCTPRHRHPVP